jgi:hypothetical protein
VTEGNRPVTGLTEADFELKDDGVRQRLELVAVESLPLTTPLVLDTSESVVGERLVQLQAAAGGLGGGLRAGATPGANSSRSTDSRSASESIASDVQPSSLKQAPKPSIAWSGASGCTNTSAAPSGPAASSSLCHGEFAVVTYHSTAGAAAPARRGHPALTASAAAPFSTARRVKGSDLGLTHEMRGGSGRRRFRALMSRFKT